MGIWSDVSDKSHVRRSTRLTRLVRSICHALNAHYEAEGIFVLPMAPDFSRFDLYWSATTYVYGFG
jgi:hypothetical protein